MKAFRFAMLLVTLSVCSCRETVQSPATHPANWQSGRFSAYGILRVQPVPYPSSTPYDNDATAKGIFLHGFSTGWDDGIMNEFPLRSTPLGVPGRVDTYETWRTGYKAGHLLGIEKFLELLKTDPIRFGVE
ncbi:MAG TPA: hypothetical protein VN625_02310 [Desulfuromonadaceae bacterium]|nr:hypothetical protein [Desulfuromonadaceae bacterium]